MDYTETIENNYVQNNDWFGSFECPDCYEQWGPTNQADPPADVEHIVKCTCGATLKICGEWVSSYILEVDLIDE